MQYTHLKHIIVLIASTNMENIRDIKKHLHEEDYLRISKITGYTSDYIKNCLDYRLNNRLIVMAAQELITANHQL